MDREDRIRARAYDIWIAEGCPRGREVEHWTRACAEVEKTSPFDIAAASTSDSNASEEGEARSWTASAA